MLTLNVDHAPPPKQWDDWMVAHEADSFQCFYDYPQAIKELSRSPTASPIYYSWLSGTETIAQAAGMVQAIGPLRFVFLSGGIVYRPDLNPDDLVSAYLRSVRRRWACWTFLSAAPNILSVRPVMTGGTAASIALKDGADSIFARLHPKWRNALKKGFAQRHRVETVQTGTPLALHLVEKEKQQRKAKAYTALDPRLPLRLANGRGATEASIYAIHCGDALLASATFIHAGQTAHYFSGYTSAHGRETCAQHALLFHACDMLAQKGCQSLDLGVIDSQKAQGLTRFKLRMGATIQTRPDMILLR